MDKRGGKKHFNKSNNKNGNYNNKPVVKKAPISSRKFVKSFTDFFDGIESIKSASLTVFDLLAEYQTDNVASKAVEDLTKDDIIETIMNIAVNHMPLPVEKKNILWEFTIAGNRCMIKTDKFVSFGWQTRIISGNEVNTFTMVVFGEGKSQEDTINNLIADGWEEVESKKPVQQ